MGIMNIIGFDPNQQKSEKNETPPEDGNSINMSSIRAKLLVDNPLFSSPHPALSIDVSVLSPKPSTSSREEPLSSAMSEIVSPTPSTSSIDSELPETPSVAMTGLSSPTPTMSEAAPSSSPIPSINSSSIPSTASEASPEAL